MLTVGTTAKYWSRGMSVPDCTLASRKFTTPSVVGQYGQHSKRPILKSVMEPLAPPMSNALCWDRPVGSTAQPYPLLAGVWTCPTSENYEMACLRGVRRCVWLWPRRGVAGPLLSHSILV